MKQFDQNHNVRCGARVLFRRCFGFYPKVGIHVRRLRDYETTRRIEAYGLKASGSSSVDNLAGQFDDPIFRRSNETLRCVSLYAGLVCSFPVDNNTKATKTSNELPICSTKFCSLESRYYGSRDCGNF